MIACGDSSLNKLMRRLAVPRGSSAVVAELGSAVSNVSFLLCTLFDVSITSSLFPCKPCNTGLARVPVVHVDISDASLNHDVNVEQETLKDASLIVISFPAYNKSVSAVPYIRRITFAVRLAFRHRPKEVVVVASRDWHTEIPPTLSSVGFTSWDNCSSPLFISDMSSHVLIGAFNLNVFNDVSWNTHVLQGSTSCSGQVCLECIHSDRCCSAGAYTAGSFRMFEACEVENAIGFPTGISGILCDKGLSLHGCRALRVSTLISLCPPICFLTPIESWIRAGLFITPVMPSIHSQALTIIEQHGIISPFVQFMRSTEPEPC